MDWGGGQEGWWRVRVGDDVGGSGMDGRKEEEEEEVAAVVRGRKR